MTNKYKTKLITFLILSALLLPFIGFYTAAYIEDEVFEPLLAATVWLVFMFWAIVALGKVNEIAIKHYHFTGIKITLILVYSATLFTAGWIFNGAWYNYYFFSGYVQANFSISQHSAYPNHFIFKGKLSDGAANTIIRQILSAKDMELNKPISLEIHSGGGAPQEAIMIADFVKHHNIQIEVIGKCISACTLILLSSESRYIHPRAWIGFHATYMIDSSNAISYDAPSLRYYDEVIQSYLKNIGTSGEFRSNANIQDSDGGYFPGYEELKSANIANKNSRLYVTQNIIPSYL